MKWQVRDRPTEIQWIFQTSSAQPRRNEVGLAKGEPRHDRVGALPTRSKSFVSRIRPGSSARTRSLVERKTAPGLFFRDACERSRPCKKRPRPKPRSKADGCAEPIRSTACGVGARRQHLHKRQLRGVHRFQVPERQKSHLRRGSTAPCCPRSWPRRGRGGTARSCPR